MAQSPHLIGKALSRTPIQAHEPPHTKRNTHIYTHRRK